jgi:hypothetical protein
MKPFQCRCTGNFGVNSCMANLFRDTKPLGLGQTKRAPKAAINVALGTMLARALDARSTRYFFGCGGKFFRSFWTALVMFFSFFSGLAFGSRVFVATPRQTSCFCAGS